jgi:hypothetical protein
MNIQPYQEESNRLKKAEAMPANVIKGAIGLAGSGALANKILPFLNQHIPENLMQKGLSKINPKLGSFVSQALDMGFGADEIRGFLSNKLGQGDKNKEEKKSFINPIQDFESTYPKIAQALANTMKNGQTPEAAAAILKNSSSFSGDIRKLEKEIGKNFIDYVTEIFGSMQQQAAPQQMQQEQPQAEQTQQANGGIDQQIMAALDRILKM